MGDNVNHVQLADGTTIIDLREDTIDASNTLKGVVGHNASGARFVGEYEGGATVTADWSVNDPENPAYVLNRTHWVEEGGEEVVGQTTFSWEDIVM